jgi:hypothetical protein
MVSSSTSPNRQQQTSIIPDITKPCAFLAIAFDSLIKLWLVNDENNTNLLGNFSLNSVVDHLFFVDSQLVATSNIGKIGAWNSMTQTWQNQDINPICSYDLAGSFLLLGGQNGALYNIHIQKFTYLTKFI